MKTSHRGLVTGAIVAMMTGPVLAEEPAGAPPPALPEASAAEAAPAAPATGPRAPRAGDFDAGGQVRLPSGPDEAGAYASFNWIAVDAKARYHLLPSVTVNATIPLAVKAPDMLLGGIEPRMIGGAAVRLEAKLPRLPRLPGLAYETEVGLSLAGAVMREGAMLLSDKDFPLFTGDFKPGLTAGLITKVKLSSVVDFALLPTFVFQSGTTENLTAVQIPIALILAVGQAVKLSTDVGINTGDDYSFGPSKGGRLSLGAALDVKVGPVVLHAGAGFASLLTDEMGLYPTIGDSVYVDLNAKFAR